jgi:hypothetical protein
MSKQANDKPTTLADLPVDEARHDEVKGGASPITYTYIVRNRDLAGS